MRPDLDDFTPLSIAQSCRVSTQFCAINFFICIWTQYYWVTNIARLGQALHTYQAETPRGPMTMGLCATLFEEDAFVAKVFSLVFLCCFGPVSSLCLGPGIGLSIGLG